MSSYLGTYLPLPTMDEEKQMIASLAQGFLDDRAMLGIYGLSCIVGLALLVACLLAYMGGCKLPS